MYYDNFKEEYLDDIVDGKLTLGTLFNLLTSGKITEAQFNYGADIIIQQMRERGEL